MHKTTYVEGDLVIECHDWLRLSANSAHYVRLGGYAGAITADVVETYLGWIGMSWIMQPPRMTRPLDEPNLEWAVRAIELAEAEGQSSATWAPLAPRDSDHLGLHLFSAPGHPRRLGMMHDGRFLMFLEQFGASGRSQWVVAVNSTLLTSRGGEPVLYDELHDAVFDQERETE